YHVFDLGDAAAADAALAPRLFKRLRGRLAAGDLQPLPCTFHPMSQARAAFCRNFLGCAGFKVRESSVLEPADLVVLCSSDAEYPELAPRVLSEAQMPVVIAGYPKDHVAALEAAGVAGFVHLGSNLPETLEAWQNRLGVHA
ncbi:MAG: hypothetical protein JNL62_25890, partial [Bryobacterales bacterium]|nr:hypothetical protein [Bryobacterales bacterium]